MTRVCGICSARLGLFHARRAHTCGACEQIVCSDCQLDGYCRPCLHQVEPTVVPSRRISTTGTQSSNSSGSYSILNTCRAESFPIHFSTRHNSRHTIAGTNVGITTPLSGRISIPLASRDLGRLSQLSLSPGSHYEGGRYDSRLDPRHSPTSKKSGYKCPSNLKKSPDIRETRRFSEKVATCTNFLFGGHHQFGGSSSSSTNDPNTDGILREGADPYGKFHYSWKKPSHNGIPHSTDSLLSCNNTDNTDISLPSCNQSDWQAKTSALTKPIEDFLKRDLDELLPYPILNDCFAVVRLVIHEARGLIAEDSGFLLRDKSSDPYCQIIISHTSSNVVTPPPPDDDDNGSSSAGRFSHSGSGRKKKKGHKNRYSVGSINSVSASLFARTTIVKKSLDPVWEDESFVIPIFGPQQRIEIRVFDYDRGPRKNEILGFCMLPMGERYDGWLQLARKADEKAGGLKVSVKTDLLQSLPKYFCRSVLKIPPELLWCYNSTIAVLTRALEHMQKMRKKAKEGVGRASFNASRTSLKDYSSGSMGSGSDVVGGPGSSGKLSFRRSASTSLSTTKNKPNNKPGKPSFRRSSPQTKLSLSRISRQDSSNSSIEGLLDRKSTSDLFFDDFCLEPPDPDDLFELDEFYNEYRGTYDTKTGLPIMSSQNHSTSRSDHKGDKKRDFYSPTETVSDTKEYNSDEKKDDVFFKKQGNQFCLNKVYGLSLEVYEIVYVQFLESRIWWLISILFWTDFQTSTFCLVFWFCVIVPYLEWFHTCCGLYVASAMIALGLRRFLYDLENETITLGLNGDAEHHARYLPEWSPPGKSSSKETSEVVLRRRKCLNVAQIMSILNQVVDNWRSIFLIVVSLFVRSEAENSEGIWDILSLLLHLDFLSLWNHIVPFTQRFLIRCVALGLFLSGRRTSEQTEICTAADCRKNYQRISNFGNPGRSSACGGNGDHHPHSHKFSSQCSRLTNASHASSIISDDFDGDSDWEKRFEEQKMPVHMRISWLIPSWAKKMCADMVQPNLAFLVLNLKLYLNILFWARGSEKSSLLVLLIKIVFSFLSFKLWIIAFVTGCLVLYSPLYCILSKVSGYYGFRLSEFAFGRKVVHGDARDRKSRESRNRNDRNRHDGQNRRNRSSSGLDGSQHGGDCDSNSVEGPFRHCQESWLSEDSNKIRKRKEKK